MARNMMHFQATSRNKNQPNGISRVFFTAAVFRKRGGVAAVMHGRTSGKRKHGLSQQPNSGDSTAAKDKCKKTTHRTSNSSGRTRRGAWMSAVTFGRSRKKGAT